MSPATDPPTPRVCPFCMSDDERDELQAWYDYIPEACRRHKADEDEARSPGL